MRLIALTTAQGNRVHFNPEDVLAIWAPVQEYHDGQVVLMPGEDDDSLVLDLQFGQYPKLLQRLSDMGVAVYDLDSGDVSGGVDTLALEDGP